VLSLLIQLTQIWCNKHRRWQHMQQWWLLRRRHDHTSSKHHVMTSFPLLLRHMPMSSFSFWFILDHSCTYFYSVLSMIFFSTFDACFLLLIARVNSFATCVNHMIFQKVVTFGQGFSSLPHIIDSALPSPVDLW
jgi:hypothetical protein